MAIVVGSRRKRTLRTEKPDTTMTSLKPGTYWLTRIVFLRCLAAIYNVAFLVALNQNKQLIGRHGLLPADLYLKSLKEQIGDGRWKQVSTIPTLLWFVDLDHLDIWLDAIAYAGLIVSFVIVVSGAANMVGMALLWLLYHSLVNVGQRWYSFGWESQTLETGFLAIFFCPLLTWKQLPKDTPPSPVVIYGFRWLIFRIMLGAGLIKIRGDQCWRHLTCMDYHYETQPVPNGNSYFMHQSPQIVHKIETAGNHFVELVAPFLLFLPFGPLVLLGGILQISFMGVIAISGNLSFLNHLTMLPSICCFDDKFLSRLFGRKTLDKVAKLQDSKEPKPIGYYVRQLQNAALLGLLVYLSVPVVKNLLSQRQMMNTSFEPLRILNTYGAFGSVTKKRTEVIVQGTASTNPNAPDSEWLEYEFKCKPGNTTRRPCYISPYHYRLDWLVWFAAFQNYQQNPWLIHFVAKMLKNDKHISDLIEHNPFLDKEPPKFIRLEHYLYKFSKIGSSDAKNGQWWTRKKIGSYMPPVNLESLKRILRDFKWNKRL